MFFSFYCKRTLIVTIIYLIFDRLKKAALKGITINIAFLGKMTDQIFDYYMKQLEEHATPTTNDKRHISYVKYINAFLSLFGKERVYLVGSTGELLKLRMSKFGGDADFLLCSGKLEIPIDNIEERKDFPCYVKIRADNLRSDTLGNIADGYLSADLLRDVRPELFTILRAIYTEVTTSSDFIPGRKSRMTTIGVPMKVGLARTEFRNLQVEGDSLPKRPMKRLIYDRSADVIAKLRKRWRGVHINMSDMKMLQRILKIVRMAKVPGSRGDNHGQMNYFAEMLESVMKRCVLEQETNGDDCAEATVGDVESSTNMEQTPQSDTHPKVRATYSDMTKKDYVPALKVIGDGRLRCLSEWVKRVEKGSWPPRNVVDEILNTDVFVVAREAPLDPESCKDFCLSFNLAEMKLGQCLTNIQRRVYLILKSYLNGVFQKRHRALSREMRLKTYYLKTAFFWVCERENPQIWTEENVIDAVKTVLQYLLRCVQGKNLSHYFVDSNLFFELEDLDCDILQHCIDEVLNNPVESIGEFKFINKDSDEREEIWLTANEARSLVELKEDSGRLQHLDKLEDEMIDMIRGFNEGPRDANGRAPIKEAVLKAFDIFFEEERQKGSDNGRSNFSVGEMATGNTTRRGKVPQAAAIAGLLGNFVTGGGSTSMNSRDANERMNVLLGLGSLIPGGSEFIADIGGREGVQRVLQQTTSQDVDYAEELRNSIDRYLSCSDKEEDSCALELKQKLTSYFIGREEN